MVSSSSYRVHRIAQNFVFILGIGLLTACSDSRPTASDIQDDFELNVLPGLLELQSFTLEGSRNAGSEERPVWMARYLAEVSTREATYDIDSVERDIRLLKPVRSAGESFTLYGRVRSAPAGDNWRHAFEPDPETDPVLGRPLSSYGPDALILGSDEAQALLAKVQKQREQEQIEREARLAIEAAERQRAEEAKRALQQRIEEAVARHNAGFAPEKIGRSGLSYGEKRAFLVNADVKGSGRVWGTDTYTSRSDFIRSVIHAGLLREGETGIVEVTMLDHQPNDFVGTPRNGIASKNATAPFFAYKMRLLEKLDD